MSSRSASAPPIVQVPSPSEDRPSWTRVGVVTAIGFVIGVVWPRVAGVRLGPSVPDVPSTTASAAALTTEVVATAPPASPASVLVPPPAAPAPAAPAGAPATTVSAAHGVAVSHGTVVGCKTTDGATQKGNECGALSGLDAVVMPRLRRMAECPDAAEEGKSRVAVRLDFAKGVADVDAPRGNLSEALAGCARNQLAGISLAGIAHDHPRYTVAYQLTWGRSSGASEAAQSPPLPAPRPAQEGSEATVQVQWDVAIVRDAPRTGKVVARLQRGTTLRVGGIKDGWYPVKYGDGFASEGWVYRAAIGR